MGDFVYKSSTPKACDVSNIFFFFFLFSDSQDLPQRSGHKPFRIKLHAALKSFELAAPDLRCKNEWITGESLCL